VVFLYDVLTVGAGFVGSFLSYCLAKRGINVLVFEEHKEIGYPEHCAGLVSTSGLQRLGLLNAVKKEGLILNTINKVRIYTGWRQKIFKITGTDIAVLDRPGLDRLIASKAQDRGAEILLDTYTKKIMKHGVKTTRGNFNGRIIVDAEGSRRSLLKKFLQAEIIRSMPAIQIDAKINKNIDTDTVEMYFNIPDFFSWIIPINTNTVRIGTASRKTTNLYGIIRSLGRKRFGKIKELKKFGGLVNVDGPYKKFTFGNIVAIGDAVGQTKPTTGGGVILGGLSAALLAATIEKNLEQGYPLQNYDTTWRKIFGTNIAFMKLIRKIVFSLDARAISNIIIGLTPNKISFASDFDLQIDLLTKKFRKNKL